MGQGNQKSNEKRYNAERSKFEMEIKREELEKLKKELEKERQEREAQELADWARDPRNATLDWGY